MIKSTCGLNVEVGERLGTLAPGLRLIGRRRCFGGAAVMNRCVEDNSLIREIMAEPDLGRVLVVNAGASLRRVVIRGAVRDLDLNAALGVTPRRPARRSEGQVGEAVSLGGGKFQWGDHVVANADEVVILGAVRMA